MTDYIITHTVPLSLISGIMKSKSKNKSTEIFNLLTRGQKMDDALKVEIIDRIRRSIKEDIFYLNKFHEYLHAQNIVKNNAKSEDYFIGDEDSTIIGLFWNQRFKSLCEKFFTSERFCYNLFYEWSADRSDENILFNMMIEVFQKHILKSVSTYDEDERKIFIKEHHVHPGLNKIVILEKLTDANTEKLILELKEKFAKMLITDNNTCGYHLDNKDNDYGKKFQQIAILMMNATKYNEDCIFYNVC